VIHGIPLFDPGDGRELLKKRCREAKIQISVLEALVEAELRQMGKLKRRGLFEEIDEILAPLAASQGDKRGH
jgi:hypothetical protein